VRIETKSNPYGGAVQTFQCLLCRAITAKVAARMPDCPLPALRKAIDQAPALLGASHDLS
jgi:hypothetical protein